MGTYLGVKVYLICELNYEITICKLRFRREVLIIIAFIL